MEIYNKDTFIVFIRPKLEAEFKKLSCSSFEDVRLYYAINIAFDSLRINPYSGIKISNKLIPKFYISKYGINNLWKYDLPKGWRLIYTIQEDKINILAIILEWFSHKEYERRFKY